MAKLSIGIIGSSSLVGTCLINLLLKNGYQVYAFSRYKPKICINGVIYRQLSEKILLTERIQYWITVAPIWVLQKYFSMLQAYGILRIIAISSTSIFTKANSSNTTESSIAKLLQEEETRLESWAYSNKIDWVILRPTLIYGLGKDKNISKIYAFIKKFKFFPILGKASGLRQPIHAIDVANACIAALKYSGSSRAYNIAGDETITYKEMIQRVFLALNYKPRFLTIPLSIFNFVINFLRLYPKYRNLTLNMIKRMNNDQVFDNSDAKRDLGFSPQAFNLKRQDLPV